MPLSASHLQDASPQEVFDYITYSYSEFRDIPGDFFPLFTDKGLEKRIATHYKRVFRPSVSDDLPELQQPVPRSHTRSSSSFVATVSNFLGRSAEREPPGRPLSQPTDPDTYPVARTRTPRRVCS